MCRCKFDTKGVAAGDERRGQGVIGGTSGGLRMGGAEQQGTQQGAKQHRSRYGTKISFHERYFLVLKLVAMTLY